MTRDPGQIDPPPRIGTRLDTAFISGIGKRADRFITLLDVDRVFSSADLGSFGIMKTGIVSRSVPIRFRSTSTTEAE